VKDAVKQTSKSRQVTLAAVFSAVYVILRIIPTFSMIGISGQFTAGDFMLTSIAAVAGLWSGAVAVLVGTILAYVVRPPLFFGLDFLPGLINISIAALLLSGRRRVAQVIYLVVLALFLVSPYSSLYGYDHIPYVWLHLVAFAVLLSPVAARAPLWIKRGGYVGVAGFAALAFVGTMAQHLVGGLLFELSLGLVGGMSPAGFAGVWQIIFFAYPIERLVILVISTILAVATFRSFQRWAPPSWRG
jgi:hypothetical protein